MMNRAIVIATDLGAAGEAVFRHEGRVGFIAGLLPGESGEVELATRGGVWRGRLIRRLSDSPDRAPHPCPHAEKCPASRFGCMSREAELNAKLIHANSTLQKIGGIEYQLKEILTAGSEWGYRNKIELSVKSRGGKILIGYHPANDSESIIPIEDCFLAEEVLRQLLHEIVTEAKTAWKSLLLKTSRLILRSGDGLHIHFLTDVQFTQHEITLLQGFFSNYSGLVGITASHNTRDEKQEDENATKIIAGELLLTGHDGVATHPLTFRQVNDAVARVLVSSVEEWCSDVVGTVFDLYGGYGPFARRIATIYGNEVYVVEMSGTAIRDGQRALKKKPLPVSYFRIDAEKGFAAVGRDIRPEAILLDPPFRGAGERMVREILSRKPRKIGYVACHGAALARDLKLFIAGGYQLSRIRLLDMFPRTPDVEWFAELEAN